MTPFRHKMHHIKAMLLDTKIFGSLNPLRICANFYGNQLETRNLHVLIHENHEKYSSDIYLENLKCSVEI